MCSLVHVSSRSVAVAFSLLLLYFSCLSLSSPLVWIAAGHLREVFREIDADNNGSICVDELKKVVKSEGTMTWATTKFAAGAAKHIKHRQVSGFID